MTRVGFRSSARCAGRRFPSRECRAPPPAVAADFVGGAQAAEYRLTGHVRPGILHPLMAAVRWCVTVLLVASFAGPMPRAMAAGLAGTPSDSSVLVAASEPAAPSASETSTSDDGLRATASPAWVPSRPVPAEYPWEFALRLPMRVATLPFSMLGYVTRNGLVYAEQHEIVRKTVQFATHAKKPLFDLYIGPAHLGPSTGVGVMAAVRPTALHGLLIAEVSSSTRNYTRTRFGLNRGPATLDYSYDWRPRDRFFGYGLASSQDSASSYAWRQQRFQLALAYPWHAADLKRPKLSLGAWAGPREVTLRHGRRGTSFEQEFPALAGFLNERQEHFVWGGRITRDTRAGRPHWGSGYLLEGQVDRFDRTISGLTIRSGNAQGPRFTRYTAQAATGVSFFHDPRTIRASVRVVRTDVASNSAALLFPDLASLGADDGLASLDLGRYRDRDALYGMLTYLIPLTTNVELEFHAEAGGVYPSLGDAKLSTLKESYGFSFRPHTPGHVVAAFGADWSPGEFVVRYSLWRGLQ